MSPLAIFFLGFGIGGATLGVVSFLLLVRWWGSGYGDRSRE